MLKLTIMQLSVRPFILALLFFSPALLFAQKTAVFTESHALLKQANDFYMQGLFGSAMKTYKEAYDRLRQVNEENYPMLESQAILGYARCAVHLDQPDGTRLIADFTREHDPDPAAQQAMLEMGNYYYNQRNYEEAIKIFNQVDAYGLGQVQRTEVLFKTGYCHFVKKEFLRAKDYFQQTIDIQNEYYYPSNYYYGLTEFFEDNYDQAINHFQRVSRSQTYNKYTPYYITQIYFAKGEFDNLLTYALPRASEPSIRNKAEINQLIGQAYFEQEKYAEALPYFEYFLQGATSIRPEDYYQIGYTYYKNNQFAEAVNNFEQLSKVSSELGQNAMYTMGDCQLKTNNKRSARIAFHLASQMDFDKKIQEVALFQYAKLSYESGFEQEALAAFLRIPPGSPHYSETQTLLSDLLLRSKDYLNSISIIEKMPDKNRDIREAYQKLSFLHGLDLYRQKNYQQARSWFQKSRKEELDKRTLALCSFWLAELEHQEKNYSLSISEGNTFLRLATNLSDFAEEATPEAANYTLGYNYLKMADFKRAYQAFSQAIKGIRRSSSLSGNREISEKMLPDAQVRAADCLLAENRYDEAVEYYNQAIAAKKGSFIYAIYQKAIIEGLRENTTEKILALEEIAQNYERSPFADDALLELGLTYIKMMRYSQAIQPLNELVRRYEGKSNLINQALLNLGLCSINQGNLNAAIDYYKEIFSHNPEPAMAQNAKDRLQEIYIETMGDSDAYLDFLNTVPEYQVDDYRKEEISYQAGESQFENGQFDKAIKAFDKYLSNYPNGRFSLFALYQKGDSHARLKAYTEALDAYEKVIERGLSNYYTEALRKAAIIAKNHNQDYQKAYDYFARLDPLAESESQKLEAQTGALECAFLSRNESGLQLISQKINENPLSTDQQKAIAAFYAGKLAFQDEDFNNALPYLNQVTELSEAEIAAEASWMIAQIDYQKRNLQAAMDRCSENISNYSKYRTWIARSVILLSDIYAEQGDILMAENMLNQVIQNFKEDPAILEEAEDKLRRYQEAASQQSKLDESSDDGLLEMDESSNQPEPIEDN